MDCPPEQKNVAGVERWPLVEVRLHIIISGLLTPKKCRTHLLPWPIKP